MRGFVTPQGSTWSTTGKRKINHTSQVEKTRDGPALPCSWVWPTEGARAAGTLASVLVAGGAVSRRPLLLPPLSLETDRKSVV